MPRTKRSTQSVRRAPVAETAPRYEQPNYNRPATLPTPYLLITLLVAVLSFSTGYLFSQVKNMSAGKSTTSTPSTSQTGQTAQQQQAPKATIDQVNKLFDTQKLVFGNKT